MRILQLRSFGMTSRIGEQRTGRERQQIAAGARPFADRLFGFEKHGFRARPSSTFEDHTQCRRFRGSRRRPAPASARAGQFWAPGQAFHLGAWADLLLRGFHGPLLSSIANELNEYPPRLGPRLWRRGRADGCLQTLRGVDGRCVSKNRGTYCHRAFLDPRNFTRRFPASWQGEFAAFAIRTENGFLRELACDLRDSWGDSLYHPCVAPCCSPGH